jgi:diguanylate cyclase (GGDEF)-like protein
MRTMSPFSLGIRQKMVLVLMCVLTVALGTTTWLTIKQNESNILNETARHGGDLARIVSQALTYEVVGNNYQTIQFLLNEIVKSQDISYAKVLSGKGNVMAEAGTTTIDGKAWTLFTQDIVFDQKPVGRVIIGVDNQRIVNRLQTQKSSVISREALIIILIAVGEFLALSYIIVRPVSIISRALNKSVGESGQIMQPIPLVARDEFGRLAVQFNEMRQQLNEANARMQSKIDLADTKLTESNQMLMQQSEELRRMNEELQRLAITDALTGLYNRRYFEDVMGVELALAIRHGDRNSILLIDIDHFKQINDTHGHRTGDQVLIEIARVLSSKLRKTDLLCRIGGEEFILLSRRADKEESMVVAEKIRQSVEVHPFFAVPGERIAVTISIGIATLPDDIGTATLGAYVHHADLALYRSKTQGRNRVTHYASFTSDEKEGTS